MPKFKNQPIYIQLTIAFLFVAIIPLLVFSELQLHKMTVDGENAAADKLRLFDKGVANQIEGWYRLNKKSMEVAATQPGMTGMDPAQHKKATVELQSQLPWMYLVHTIDAKGHDIARNDDKPLAPYPDRRFYTDIFAGQPFSVDLQIGRTSKKPALLMGAPIPGADGKPLGSLATAANLDEITDAVAGARLGKTGYVILMTGDGKIIAHPFEPMGEELLDYSDRPVFKAAQNFGKLLSYQVDSVDRLGYSAQLPNGWIVVAQQDRAEAMAAVIDAEHRAWLLMALTAIIVAAMSLFAARSFSRPIAEATAVADRISQGQLDDDELDADRGDEMGKLAQAINRMSRTVQGVVSAQKQMAEAHDAGDIDYRIPANDFPGAFGDMARGTNEVAAEHVRVMLLMGEVFGRYAVGDFSSDLPPLPGKKAALTESATTAKQNLLAIQQQIMALAQAAARGDFSQRGDAERFQFLYRDMVQQLNRLMEMTDRGLREVAAVLSHIADGDLTRRMSGDYQGLFAELQRDANGSVSALAELLTSIQASANSVELASREILQGNSDLSARTEQQAAGLEETAASMEELMSTVRGNSENAVSARDLASQASHTASEGGAVVGRMVEVMGEINTATRSIGEIISMIDGIAFQTNLLALNAAVEAARAGEHGRGFAVVATEVRALASRAADAARQISTLVNSSIEKVQTGNSMAREAGSAIERIVSASASVEGIMAQISQASVEQTQNIEQVGSAVTMLDEVTQQNAALVEEVAAATRSMTSQATELLDQVQRFQLEKPAASRAA